MKHPVKNQYILYENYAECFMFDTNGNTQGSFIIDVEDVEKCKKYKWSMRKKYIRSTISSKKISLHRYILDYNGPLQVDHINRNPRDNRKENLRIVSGFVNNQNNGCIGVSFDQHAKKWKAEYQRYGKAFYAGIFDTKEEAIEARKEAIKKTEKEHNKLLENYNKKDEDHSVGVRPSAHGRWVAKFCADNKVYHVGTFDTKEEAIEARKEAIAKHAKIKQTA